MSTNMADDLDVKLAVYMERLDSYIESQTRLNETLCARFEEISDELDEIKICIAYVLKGKKLDYLPAASEDQFNIKPIYKTFPGWKSKTQGIRNIKAQRALRSMQSMSGFKNASIEDAINMGFAGGFIPSFADMRSRQQKIRDVLADPANKNVRFKGGAMTTKTFNTKARGGMFHSIYVESYLNTGNQSDLDYLEQSL